MNTERTGLEHRARWHAALADPVRLRIMDLVAISDRSPGELRAGLGVSSNLLAHHLGVLETEGIITRRRSEGDHRRSYVHLRPSALAAAVPDRELTALRLVFVCSGNSARSPLAAALWTRASPVPATSAGTHPADQACATAIAAARSHGLDLAGHRPRHLADVLAEGDVVVTVCDRAHEELGSGGTLHWSVPNPALDGAGAAYDAAFEEIARRVENSAPYIRAA